MPLKLLKMPELPLSVAVIAMLLYIAWAFRKMPNPFKYGVCAIAGLAFDLLIALGSIRFWAALRGLANRLDVYLRHPGSSRFQH